jgi:hypothetical protein
MTRCKVCKRDFEGIAYFTIFDWYSGICDECKVGVKRK